MTLWPVSDKILSQRIFNLNMGKSLLVNYIKKGLLKFSRIIKHGKNF